MFIHNSHSVIQAKLSSAFKGMLLIDKDCGKRPLDCKKYCQDCEFFEWMKICLICVFGIRDLGFAKI
jgi:hypothetical protein